MPRKAWTPDMGLENKPMKDLTEEEKDTLAYQHYLEKARRGRDDRLQEEYDARYPFRIILMCLGFIALIVGGVFLIAKILDLIIGK